MKNSSFFTPLRRNIAVFAAILFVLTLIVVGAWRTQLPGTKDPVTGLKPDSVSHNDRANEIVSKKDDNQAVLPNGSEPKSPFQIEAGETVPESIFDLLDTRDRLFGKTRRGYTRFEKDEKEQLFARRNNREIPPGR